MSTKPSEASVAVAPTQSQLEPEAKLILAEAELDHSTAQAVTWLSCNSNSETGQSQLDLQVNKICRVQP
jgi:hypothetical protein